MNALINFVHNPPSEENKMTQKHIKIATRKSKLALWQANFVKSALENRYPELQVSLFEMVTEGDRQQNIPLTQMGGKSVFVKSLQNALLNNEADIAVHSIKDMSVHDANGLTLAAICERKDARDAFISNHYADIDTLPLNAVVGTASPRRESLLKSMRPDIQITLLRGNVDTRLSKLDNGDYDAIILAAAGIHRLGLSNRIRSYLSDDFFIPAIGQGAIGVECRTDDHFIRDLSHFLNHTETANAVIAERVVNKILGGDCHTAIGAHAKITGSTMHLAAMIGSQDGKLILRATADSNTIEPKTLGERVANDLISQGAQRLIHHA